MLTVSGFVIAQNLDEAHSSPGLHAAAGPGLAEECATLVMLESGMVILLYNFVGEMETESWLFVCGTMCRVGVEQEWLR